MSTRKRKPKLAWNSREGRWRFKFRNRSFAASPAQLQCEADSREASADAAKAWRDARIAEIELEEHSRTAGQLQLLVALEHAIRNRGRNARLGRHDAVRAWANIANEIERQLEVYDDVPAGFVVDDNGARRDSESAADPVVTLARATLIAHDEQQIATFAEGFGLSKERLRSPLPTERVGLSISEAVTKYVETTQADNSIEYVAAVRRHLARLVTILGGENEVSSLTAPSILTLKAELLKIAKLERPDHDSRKTSTKPWTSKHIKDSLSAMRTFVKWCYDNEYLPHQPRNLGELTYKVIRPEIKTYSAADVRKIVDAAEENELLQLAVLLMANCGMTQSDVAALKRAEIDLERGTITRRRTKTAKQSSTPIVRYLLWERTLELLRKQMQRSGNSETALVDVDGSPLLSVTLIRGARDRISKVDRIHELYRKLRESENLPAGKSLKHLRKTSATLIASKYGDGLAKHFLGHAPSGVAERHYIARQQEQFDEALRWLHNEYFGQG